MHRRAFIAGAIAALAPVYSRSLAQQAKAGMPRIGFLGAATAAGFANQIGGLRKGLRELGYVEGKNIAIEFRWAEGKLDRLPALAGELVREVDLIVTQGVPATRAAKGASSTIPIVMAAVGDPLVMGIVPSLARPGGNVTGMTFFAPELAAKRVELIKDTLPHAKRIAILFNPDNPIQRGPVLEAAAATAAASKLVLERVAARAPDQFDGALAAIAAKRVDAVMFIEDPMHLVHANALVELAIRNRLIPFGGVEFASAGCVLGYGVNFPELYRRSAFFIDRILKGAKPADLPIEQATRFELVINLKTARALGVAISRDLLHRAERVIE